MDDQEKFDPMLINAEGYAEKFPLEPLVIEQDLEDATSPLPWIQLSADLTLEQLNRISGLAVYKNHKVVNDLKDLSSADLQLIREFLDGGRGGNELIPEPDE